MPKLGPAFCVRCQNAPVTYHCRPSYYELERRTEVPFPLCAECTKARYASRATYQYIPPLGGHKVSHPQTESTSSETAT